jgi:Mrp family chromosome partitioning ATPase
MDMSTKKACESCTSGTCSSRPRDPQETDEQYASRMRLAERTAKIKHKILVLSGKGGVGKSTVAANLAMHLALNGRRVGLLDVDIHGPSIPRLFGLEGKGTFMVGDSMMPMEFSENLKIMSIAFCLSDSDAALIWRGPMKIGVIRQFLADVEWGDLDYLVVDCPPGTGDEPLSAVQMLNDADGAVVVTTPQTISVDDVRRSISFCRKLNLPVLGVIENMSGFVCPKCGEVTDIFGAGGGEEMATSMGVPFLGRIPIDPAVRETSDQGKPHAYYNAKTPSGQAFAAAFDPLLALPERDCAGPQA